MGDSWPIPRYNFPRGFDRDQLIKKSGKTPGDELTGPSACTNLLSSKFTEPGGELDPQSMAGTVRIVPVINLPGYRSKSRYFPDGRDLNRAFPGLSKGSPSKVASTVQKTDR
ncbi:MAG: hypothetical protein CM15mP1_0030 [Methanobacteriota archaeon]|nr:MAG: hypothetical protein CM15mP1_0030 [Euryarchaeota archaeon]